MAYRPLSVSEMQLDHVTRMLQARGDLDVRFSGEAIEKIVGSAVADRAHAADLVTASSLARGLDGKTSIRDVLELFERNQDGLFSRTVKKLAPELVGLLVALSQQSSLERLAASIQPGGKAIFGLDATPVLEMSEPAIRARLEDPKAFDHELTGAQVEEVLRRALPNDPDLRSDLLSTSSSGRAASGNTSIASILENYRCAQEEGGMFSRTIIKLTPILVEILVATSNGQHQGP